MHFTANGFCMTRIFSWLDRHPESLFLVAAALLPFALLINLGLMPLISDEPTRGIVTLEMIISGNYISPTINGAAYFNKPPLFNWILAGIIHLSGNNTEFILRLPTIISLILTALSIFLFTRKSLGKVYAGIAAFMFITAARILFWDSFQALIDISYSLVTFCSFIALFEFFKRRRFTAVFLTTYAFTATGFLMKGIPSLAFQGISLLAWFIYEREFRKLFSLKHLAGILLFFAITGTYYFFFLQNNSLDDVFSTLLDQSNRINDKSGTFLSWFLHLFLFPFEMAYEFAPWTLLGLLFLSRAVRELTFSDKLFRFSALMLLANIGIYWVSADMRPRYLFMLFPLLFIILSKAYQVAVSGELKIRHIPDFVYQLLMIAGTLSLPVYMFWDETRLMPHIHTVIPALFALSSAATLMSFRLKNHRLLLMIIVLLTVRTAFNLYNLPARFNSYPDAGYRQGGTGAAREAGSDRIYILGDTPFNHDASFYMSRESGKIISRTREIADKHACYICDEKNLANFADELTDFKIVSAFRIKLNETRLYLLKETHE